jgi:glycosyltransferase involved in cell wall biosynthesis
MNKIKIIFLASSMHIGGQEQYIAQQIINMDRSKFEPTLCCLKELGPMADPVVAAGIPVVSGFQRYKYDLFSLWRLTRFLLSSRPDILYIFDFRNVLFIGRLAAKLSKVKVVVIASHKMNYNNSGCSFKLLDRLLMPLSDHVIAAANIHLESLITNDKISPHKVTTIHNGIQLSRLEEDLRDTVYRADMGIPDGAKIVGTVARLSPEKAQKILLDAAEIIVQAVPETHFIFIGDGPERQSLEEKASSLGLTEKVHFLGFKKRVAPTVKLFDVFTLSSTSTELFSAATLEAMALGIPVVVTDIGSMSEMVISDSTGFLVSPNDPNALAEKILHLLNNPDMARKMSMAARLRVEQFFTAQREADQIQALFKELLLRKKKFNKENHTESRF